MWLSAPPLPRPPRRADLACLDLRHDVLVRGDALEKAVLAFTRTIVRSSSDMAAAGAHVWGIAVQSLHVRSGGGGGASGASGLRPARDPVTLLNVAGVERSRKAFTSLVRAAIVANLGISVLADAPLAAPGESARMVHVRKQFVLHFCAGGAVWRSFAVLDLQSAVTGVFTSSMDAVTYAGLFAGGGTALAASTEAAMCVCACAVTAWWSRACACDAVHVSVS